MITSSGGDSIEHDLKIEIIKPVDQNTNGGIFIFVLISCAVLLFIGILAISFLIVTKKKTGNGGKETSSENIGQKIEGSCEIKSYEPGIDEIFGNH